MEYFISVKKNILMWNALPGIWLNEKSKMYYTLYDILPFVLKKYLLYKLLGIHLEVRLTYSSSGCL